MRVACEVTFICYSPFSLDIFPRNVQNKLINFRRNYIMRRDFLHLKAPENWS